jgi:hypothetical protein
MKRTLRYLIPALVAVAILCGCKAHVSLSGATIPDEASTVSVGFFTNNTTLGSPGLAQRFTERLRDMVSQQTRLQLIKQGGDLQFEGYISDYAITPVAVQSNDVAALNRLTISVKVAYINKFEAAKSFDQTFTRFADFPSSQNFASLEVGLVTEINRQLTEDIFNKAFNNW